MKTEKGGRRKVKNLLSYEGAQLAVCPCPLCSQGPSPTGSPGGSCKEVIALCFKSLYELRLWHKHRSNPSLLEVHMSVDQENGAQIFLVNHKKPRLGGSQALSSGELGAGYVFTS